MDSEGYQSERSIVDVFIRYPADSVVDIDDVTNKLTLNNGLNSVDANITANQNKTSEHTHPDILDLRQRNASLFWGLIIFCVIVVIMVIVVICCNCCPGCYFYQHNKRSKRKTEPSADLEVNHKLDNDDITVLTVKNENGEKLTDAKFVEIIKSAKNRIR